MSILVRNLPRSLTEAELQALFAPFGDIASCTVVLDDKTGQSKGFGFVEFVDENVTDVAIDALNGKKLSGNKIRVKRSKQEAFKQAQAEQQSQNVWQQAWGKSEGQSEASEDE